MTRPLVVIFLTIFVNLVGFGIIIPLLPFYAETFGASPLVVGLLFAVFSLCQLVAAPILGDLSDRYGRRPILIVSLAVGLAVSLFQSVTQIQEVTLSFVPKLVGVGLVLMLGGHWMLAELIGFTNHLFDMVPRLLQSA